MKSIEKRIQVLKYSLILEKQASLELSNLLFIKDISKTKSLGNKSESLSFNQKINILVDSGVVDTDYKKKFQHFMSIRNQFMHNIDSDTYEKVINQFDGLFNFLRKNYQNNFELKPNPEDFLELSVKHLFQDCINHLMERKGLKSTISKNHTLKEYYEKRYNCLKKSIEFNFNEFQDYIKINEKINEDLKFLLYSQIESVKTNIYEDEKQFYIQEMKIQDHIA
ncbi:MAG: hypothetical protein Q8K92_07445 [Leadbetterella sp.]|nr:hypothetical protein [Leadbetterella sp.]